MQKKKLKRLISLCLGIGMVCLPLSVDAQEMDSETVQKEASVIPFAYADMFASNLDISDAYAEVTQLEMSDEDYVLNHMEKSCETENLEVTELPNNVSAYSESGEQENTDPNYAYLVEHGNVVQGTLLQTGEMRWYGFILDKSSKASVKLQTVSEVDADMYLFKLDQDAGKLNLIGGSATSGLGLEEYCSNILDSGIYYIAVSAYDGQGRFAFAFYATQDMDNEVNDTISDAAEVGVNSTVTGVIDNPFDRDFYTFTLASPVIMGMTTDVGNYQFSFQKLDNSGSIYEISKKDSMYQFDAGTYCFEVYSKDGTYDADKAYSIKLNKIANIAANDSSFYYMVNEKANIVFQSDSKGKNMYVNGHPIDISYNYYSDKSNSAGTQKHDITITNSWNLRAKIFQNQYVFENAEVNIYFGMTMPDTVNYMRGSKGVGPTGNVLELSLFTDSSLSDNFYQIHCVCTGAYAKDYYYDDLNFVTVFINPNTGKLVDIQHINYFYEEASGSNSMMFTRPYGSYTKYYYPYYNGQEPTTW